MNNLLARFFTAVLLLALFSFNVSGGEKQISHVCIFNGGGFGNDVLEIKISGDTNEYIEFVRPYCTNLGKPIRITIFVNGEERLEIIFKSADIIYNYTVIITKRGGAVSLKSIPHRGFTFEPEK